MPETGKNAIIGTTKAGYLPPKKGPCVCERCIHFHDDVNSCDHPDVITDARNGELPMLGDKAIVEQRGFCDYFNPGSEKSGIARFIGISK